MFGRSTQLTVIVKPIIEQIADFLILAGFRALISDQRTWVDSSTNGYNFRVYEDEKNKRISFRMGLENTIGYQLAYANKFNGEMIWGKVTVAPDNQSIWLEADAIYTKNSDNSEIFGEYIILWNLLVGAYIRSMSEAQARAAPSSPLALTNSGENSLI